MVCNSNMWLEFNNQAPATCILYHHGSKNDSSRTCSCVHVCNVNLSNDIIKPTGLHVYFVVCIVGDMSALPLEEGYSSTAMLLPLKTALNEKLPNTEENATCTQYQGFFHFITVPERCLCTLSVQQYDSVLWRWFRP